MSNFPFSFQDPSLLQNLDFLGRSLNGSHAVQANPTLLGQLSGQHLKNGPSYYSPQITKRPNNYEMDQPMIKKLKSQMVLGGHESNIHDVINQPGFNNNARLNMLLSNLNEQELNHQITQFQTPMDIFQGNPLLNMGQNNLFQSKLFQSNQKNVNLNDILSLNGGAGISLDLLAGLTRNSIPDLSYQPALTLQTFELLQQQQQQLQQQQLQQQQLHQLQQQPFYQKQLQKQQQQQQHDLLMQLQLNSQPFIDISGLGALTNIDDYTLSQLQNPLIMNPGAQSLMMLPGGQLIPVQQNLNFLLNPQPEQYSADLSALLLKKQATPSAPVTVEQSKPKIPQLYIPEQEIVFEEKKSEKASGLISDDSTKCSDLENKTEDEPEVEDPNKTTPMENKPKIARPKKVLFIPVKSPEVESPEDSTKNINGERKKNRWQVVQEEKEKAMMAEKVRLINESNIRHEDQKITNTPIGPNHQADLNIIELIKDKPKRVIKQKWNPENFSEESISTISKEIEIIIESEVDQQKLTTLLNETNCNTEETLKLIRNDKKKFVSFFNIKPQKKKTLL